MLSIFILFFTFIFLFLRSRHKTSKTIHLACLGVFNLFIVECFIYGYFIYLILQEGGFFLIGNQWFLDKVAQYRLAEITYYSQYKKDKLFRLDDELGYTIGERRDTGEYETNSQGIRSRHEYPLAPSPDRLRLAVFGDSFVYCDTERIENSWPFILENTIGNLEVLNFGVPGFGLGQSYLRYLKDGLRFKPDIIFFNYIHTGGRDALSYDLLAMGNLRSAYMYRVMFWVEDGTLKSHSVNPSDLFDRSFREQHIYQPLKIFQRQSFWRNPFFSVSNLGLLLKQWAIKRDLKSLPPLEVEEVNKVLLKNLLEVAREQNSAVIFFVPGNFADLSQPIQKVLNDYGRRVVYVNSKQMLNTLMQKSNLQEKDILNKSQHYNAKGNLLYAQAVLQVLRMQNGERNGRPFTFDPLKRGF